MISVFSFVNITKHDKIYAKLSICLSEHLIRIVLSIKIKSRFATTAESWALMPVQKLLINKLTGMLFGQFL